MNDEMLDVTLQDFEERVKNEDEIAPDELIGDPRAEEFDDEIDEDVVLREIEEFNELKEGPDDGIMPESEELGEKSDEEIENLQKGMVFFITE